MKNNEWKKLIIDPSYSSLPDYVLIEIGENVFQRIVSQTLIAINNEIPEFPIPYPFYSISSNKITTIPAKVN